jgi:hypothetical protein
MEKSEKPLNEKQERFCMLLAIPDEVGRQLARADAYMVAFNRTSSRTYASINACKLLKDPRVQRRLRELSEKVYDRYVEERLPFATLVDKLRDRVDDPAIPSAQLKAIQMALDLREKYGPPREEDQYPKPWIQMSDAELLAEARRQGLW